MANSSSPSLPKANGKASTKRSGAPPPRVSTRHQSNGEEKVWTVQDSEALYQVRDWGHPYFSVNEKGHVEVTPDPSSPNAINLYELTLDMRARGIELPLLVRFSDILAHRIRRIHEAFARAMKEYEYQGSKLPCREIRYHLRTKGTADPYNYKLNRCRVADGSWKIL